VGYLGNEFRGVGIRYCLLHGGCLLHRIPWLLLELLLLVLLLLLLLLIL
jgi:hypothetical protein